MLSFPIVFDTLRRERAAMPKKCEQFVSTTVSATGVFVGFINGGVFGAVEGCVDV